MALLFFVRISGRCSAGAGMVGDRTDETLRRRCRMQGNFIEYVAMWLAASTSIRQTISWPPVAQ
ncbi:hypothetical protein [Rhizobium leguminosarum]